MNILYNIKYYTYYACRVVLHVIDCFFSTVETKKSHIYWLRIKHKLYPKQKYFCISQYSFQGNHKGKKAKKYEASIFYESYWLSLVNWYLLKIVIQTQWFIKQNYTYKL